MKQTAFNLDAFKKGAKVVNKLGNVAKFICESRGKMIVSIQPRYGQAYTERYNLDGKKYTVTNCPLDLEMA